MATIWATACAAGSRFRRPLVLAARGPAGAGQLPPGNKTSMPSCGGAYCVGCRPTSRLPAAVAAGAAGAAAAPPYPCADDVRATPSWSRRAPTNAASSPMAVLASASKPGRMVSARTAASEPTWWRRRHPKSCDGMHQEWELRLLACNNERAARAASLNGLRRLRPASGCGALLGRVPAAAGLQPRNLRRLLPARQRRRGGYRSNPNGICQDGRPGSERTTVKAALPSAKTLHSEPTATIAASMPAVRAATGASVTASAAVAAAAVPPFAPASLPAGCSLVVSGSGYCRSHKVVMPRASSM